MTVQLLRLQIRHACFSSMFGHGIVVETAMSLSHGCIQMITNLYADTGVCNKMKHAVWAQQLHKVRNKASYELYTVW